MKGVGKVVFSGHFGWREGWRRHSLTKLMVNEHLRGVQDMSSSHGVGKVVFLATLAGERGGEGIVSQSCWS